MQTWSSFDGSWLVSGMVGDPFVGFVDLKTKVVLVIAPSAMSPLQGWI